MQIKRLWLLQILAGASLGVLGLASLALANPGAACHAVVEWTSGPTGIWLQDVRCTQNTCDTACDDDGTSPEGRTTCICPDLPGGMTACNVAWAYEPGVSISVGCERQTCPPGDDCEYHMISTFDGPSATWTYIRYCVCE